VACIAIGGGVDDAGRAALEPLGVTVVPVWEVPVTLAVAIAAGAAPIEACAARLARTVAQAARGR
jgi:hypothetical protein